MWEITKLRCCAAVIKRRRRRRSRRDYMYLSQPTLHYCAHSNRVVIGNCDKWLITGLCAGVSATELVDVVILLCSYLPAAQIRECSE